MSPSRAGSSDNSRWRIFSSARRGAWPFSLQLESENRPKTSRKWAKIRFSIFIIKLYWKLLNYAAKLYNSTLKTPYLLINDHEIDWNHVIEAKSDNKNLGKNEFKKFETFWHTYCQLSFSSKMKVPQLGLTWLGTFTARARWSWKIPAWTHL